MKLFYGLKDATERYYDSLTEAQIEELERQGTDVTEIREKQREKAAIIEKAGETDISLLEEYENIPRDTDTPFFKSIAGSMPLFGKKKHIAKYQQAKIVYPVVVQADPVLYEPGDTDTSAIVVLFARDEKHAKDFQCLYTLADLFIALRDDQVEVPASCKNVVEKLRNSSSHIVETIPGESIDESFRGVDICVYVIYVSQERLPGKRIPSNGILPSLYFEHAPDNFYLKMIDGHLYKGI